MLKDDNGKEIINDVIIFIFTLHAPKIKFTGLPDEKTTQIENCHWSPINGQSIIDLVEEISCHTQLNKLKENFK